MPVQYPSGRFYTGEDRVNVYEIVCSNDEELEECYEKLLNYVTKDNIAKFTGNKVCYPNIDVRCTRSEWYDILFHLGLFEENKPIAFY